LGHLGVLSPSEELLSHRLAEGFISELQPHSVRRFRVIAGDVAEVVLPSVAAS
jgi:hypothetical protein